eukprot:TRINITY_DN13920_c0_g1_i2.p1 TRINITY_DN13920_c0_g1~~TRINITY_DN13920_c0_g1_i2.p1  ORF type:complete len:365 (+),score=49.39 TRINITY_DN13920_c0_g1_i2:12-1106(+)
MRRPVGTTCPQILQSWGAGAKLVWVIPLTTLAAPSVDTHSLLYALGCRVPNFPTPNHGVEKVTLEYAGLAVQIQGWRELRNLAVQRQNLRGLLEGSPGWAREENVPHLIQALSAPSWLQDKLTQGTPRFIKETLVAWIQDMAPGLEERMQALRRGIDETIKSMPTTVSIVNVSGLMWALSRYTGRSCRRSEGMWQIDTRQPTLKKMKLVASTLGMSANSSALYLGAGCGAQLEAFEAIGVSVVSQDLMKENLDYLHELKPSMPLCGGESSHFLSSVVTDSFDYVVTNSILVPSVTPEARCEFLQNALRVSRRGVYIGWVESNASDWLQCGHDTMFTVNEQEFFGSVEYDYGTFHSLFAKASSSV